MIDLLQRILGRKSFSPAEFAGFLSYKTSPRWCASADVSSSELVTRVQEADINRINFNGHNFEVLESIGYKLSEPLIIGGRETAPEIFLFSAKKTSGSCEVFSELVDSLMPSYTGEDAHLSDDIAFDFGRVLDFEGIDAFRCREDSESILLRRYFFVGIMPNEKFLFIECHYQAPRMEVISEGYSEVVKFLGTFQTNR